MKHQRAQSDPMWFDTARQTAAVFSGMAAIVLSGVYYLLRLGFEDDSLNRILQTLPLSLFVLSCPSFCSIAAVALRIPLAGPWMRSDGLLSLAGLGILIVSGMIAGSLGIQTALLWRIVGLSIWFVVFACWLQGCRIISSILFLAASLLFSLGAAGAAWGWAYQNPLYEEALACGYYLCKDILSAVSVTNMLMTYGFPSFGLDGLVYCYYHWGAYWIFAQLSQLIDTNQINFSQLCFPVIFIPFFLCRLIVFAIDIRECLPARAPLVDIRRDKWFWLLLSAALIGFVPSEAAQKMAFGFDYKFISENYTVGLGITFAIMSVLTEFFKMRDLVGSLQLSDRFVICIMAVLIIVVGFIKISLMFLLVLMLGYLVLRLRLWKHLTVTCTLLFTAVALPVVVKLTVAPGDSGLHFIYPFGFFISNIAFGWKPVWPIFYFFWSWLFIIWMLHVERIYTVYGLQEALRHKRILPVEVVAAACLLGAGPAMLFAIPGGSGVYFMDFQTWLSLGLLLGYLNTFRAHTFQGGADREERRGIGNIRLRDLWLSLAGIFLVWMLVTNGAQALWRMIDVNLAIRCELKAQAEGVSSAADLKPRFAEAATSLRSFNPNPLFRVIKEQVGPLFMLGREQVQKARHWPVMEALLTISNTPLSEKRQSAVYVPRSNSAYWSLSHQCEVTPIIVPAIAAVAMIDGLPGPDCKTTGWAHHYSAYKALSAESEALGGFQEMQMCSHAKAKGFSRVIVLDQDQSGAIVTRKVPCP